MGISADSFVADLRELPVPASVLGENPLWDAPRGLLYWEDIDRGILYAWSEAEQSCRIIYQGETVGGFTLQDDGNLLLFRVTDIVLLCPDSGKVTPFIRFDLSDGGRFNDVIADPLGRVYCGRLTCNNDTGGLYRLHQNGELELLWKGSGIPNGMAFSADWQTFYWTCSPTRTIFRFRHDPVTGALSDREVFRVVEGDEIPDGLTMDRRGVLYSARWDGYGIEVLDTNANILGRIDLPVAQVTSVAAGGAHLDQLYITTAGGSENSNGPEGKLFVARLLNGGRLELRSKIRGVEPQSTPN